MMFAGVASRAPSSVVVVNAAVRQRRGPGSQTPRGRCAIAHASAAASYATSGAKIAGVGKALPMKFLTNNDLSELVETNDEWIATRTGIKKRHIITGDESLTSLGAEAAKQALERANVKAEDVDLIILATSSPDDIFGSACTDLLLGS
jgi:3-oxoacyl-[acyl-carrier-protein] synthase-3